MNYYRYSGQLCDAIITVEGGQFHVHKEVLCNLSPYFRALFSRWSNPSQFMYNIPGVAPKIMKSILQYAYSNRIRITPGNVQELLVAADYLLVGSIISLCSQFLQRQLCPEMKRFANSLSLNKICHRAFLMSELKMQTCLRDDSAYSQLQSTALNSDNCCCLRCQMLFVKSSIWYSIYSKGLTGNNETNTIQQ
ncbi:Kelch-like protein 10 [Bagarius yarrelli]|uniref:Kelch-like protein 10 n=1 Tax=Bagarius yarrelli TaxID=175774 RepID=A0A556TZY8_BAGYA|nr:Kelch-like protein 10 [Bagarius yarrelli]